MKNSSGAKKGAENFRLSLVAIEGMEIVAFWGILWGGCKTEENNKNSGKGFLLGNCAWLQVEEIRYRLLCISSPPHLDS